LSINYLNNKMSLLGMHMCMLSYLESMLL